MSSQKVRFHHIAIIFTSLAFKPSHVQAQEAGQPLAPRTQVRLPSKFDQTTIQTFLDTIEQPRVASTLKRGYFARRGQPNFPFAQALLLVDAAIAKETVGSKRWFELENVRGYAILKTNALSSQEGMAAYGAIFDAAGKAAASNALYPLQVSIAEYTGYLSDPSKKRELQDEPQAKVILLKAWNAYALTTALPMKGNTAPPDFMRAFAVLGSDTDTLTTVEKTLSDPKTPRSFELLVTGATLVASKQPEQALAWLKEAKPLLPVPPTQDPALASLAMNAIANYYDLLVGILQSNKRFDDAIIAQRERIVRIGSGYGPLWGLLRATGDTNGQNAVLSRLKSRDIPGREVLRAANNIGQFSLLADPLPGGPEAAISVLQAFLAPGRVRTPEEEIQARLWLGAYYWRRKDIEKARAVVVMPEPKQLTPSDHALWSDLERLRQTVADSIGTNTK